jgi:hypothetical protein
MRPTLFATLAATAIGGAVLLTSGPADAQSRKRSSDDMFFYTSQQREYRHRVRPRVVVRSRSYLDPGLCRALRLFGDRQRQSEPHLEPEPVQRAVRYAGRTAVAGTGRLVVSQH